MVDVRSNTAEGGTNGTAVTTGNSGGTSGDAWSQASGVTYTSSALAGSMSIAGSTSTTAAVYYFGWQGLTASSYAQASATVALASLPPTSQLLLKFSDTTASNALAGFGVTTGGLICAWDSNAAVVQTGTTTITAGQAFTLTAHCVGSATVGQVRWDLYLSGSSTPSESLTTAATLNTFTQVGGVFFGHSGYPLAAASNMPATRFDSLSYTNASTVPTNLHTTSVGSTTASLAWDASFAATSYDVLVTRP